MEVIRELWSYGYTDASFFPFYRLDERPFLVFVPVVGWVMGAIYIITMAIRLQVNAILALLSAVAYAFLGGDILQLSREPLANAPAFLAILFGTLNAFLLLFYPKSEQPVNDSDGNVLMTVRVVPILIVPGRTGRK